jgi:FMN phosphatase YigB (HAD superfamily)
MLTLVLLTIIYLLFICLAIKHFRIIAAPFVRLWKKAQPHLLRTMMRVGDTIEITGSRLKDAFAPPLPLLNDNLTPFANADDSKVYMKLLKQKTEDPDAKNIALTGAYGSGKSSILRTFQFLHPEFRYLNISLAAFNDDKPSTDEIKVMTGEAVGQENGASALGKKATVELRSKIDIAAVEYSILQQIFYHVRHQQIPFSRFKRIKNLPSWLLFIRASLLVLWGFAVSFLIWHEKLFTNTKIWETWIHWPPKPLAAAILVFTPLYAIYIIYVLFRIYNNSEFHKLNLTSGEVEIKPVNELSILNKHLDELIYFFEATDYGVLVIEDLDRFNDADIFVHLRELNTLINNSRQVGRKVTFIYALKDEVFKDEKRTKFFDYIIPVIPVIDNKNSGEKLRLRLENIGLVNNEIPADFISDISFYIDDMRLLINTVNVFDVYRKKLHENSPESYVRLLAMMVFKNKYPKLFAKLNKRKGLAYEILNGREDFLRRLSEDLRNKQNALEENIWRNNEIYKHNVLELRTVYVYQILKNLPDNLTELAVGSNNTTLQVRELAEENGLEQLFTERTIRYFRSNSGIGNTNLSFSAIENEVDPDRTYKKREEELKTKKELKINQLESELQDTLLALDKMRQLTLQGIFAERSLERLKPEYVQNGLLTYLVTNGHLTEDYHYYLSYFYPGSLTRPDMDFIFAVKERKTLPFDYKLEKTSELVKRLHLSDFTADSVLNNQLVNYLLANDKDDPRLLLLIRKISTGQKNAIEFIMQYLRIGEQHPAFVNLLAKSWPKLWRWVKLESKLPQDLQRKYLLLILVSCDIKDLSQLNIQHALNDEIEPMPDFISWTLHTISSSRIIDIMEELDLRFKSLNDLDPKSNIFDFLLRYSHYDLNPHMISFIARLKGKNITQETLNKVNLTTVLSSHIQPLIGYIKKNPGYYLENVWLELPSSREESAETVLWLIKNEELGNEQASSMIIHNQTRLPDIERAPEQLWPVILENSRMTATWLNVFKVYQKNKALSAELVIFLNNAENYEVLERVAWSKIPALKRKRLAQWGKSSCTTKALTPMP